MNMSQQQIFDEARKRNLGFSEEEIMAARPRRSKRAKAGHLTEYEEQKRFVKWLKETYPEHRRRIMWIGNSAHRGSIMRAAADKASGMLVGASDLFFRLPVGRFHGLWIEMKTVVGRPTPEETRFLDEVRADGFAGCVCRGQDEAKAAIRAYLVGSQP